jgi:7-carboxy-7-deazaguanine synthase
MRGKNPIRQPVHDEGEVLSVVSIFPTLQGEGPYAGVPAVFIRLGGCNLACTFCDTDFESFESMLTSDVARKVVALAENDRSQRVRHLVVITGGEPMRQNIVPLCEALVAAGFTVQIETNGTLYRSLPEAVQIICSPKNTGQGYFPVREDLLARVNAFKFIISAHDPLYKQVGEAGQSRYHTPVYVQPMDEYDATLNRENTDYALQLATMFGYRLSLQTHKMLGIP